MRRHFTLAIAAATMTCFAAPAVAQEEIEEARTTYVVEFLKFAPDMAEKWTEMHTTYWAPAAKNAGMPAAEVHWMMDGQWDLMIIREVPRGMAAFDTHASPERTRWLAEFHKLVGGEDAAAKMDEANGTLVESSMRFFSHTHP